MNCWKEELGEWICDYPAGWPLARLRGTCPYGRRTARGTSRGTPAGTRSTCSEISAGSQGIDGVQGVRGGW